MAANSLTVVIGAGICGLACAYALKKAGENVLLLESSGRPGGVIESVQEAEFLFELGPQSFSGTEPLFQLCDELGISDQLVEAPHSAPRYIWLNGKLVPVPFSSVAFLSSSLLSWRSKFSILTEVFRTTLPPETDESVAAFVRTRFTQELLDRLVGPFVSGIYAGDPEQLSLRAAFPKIHQAQSLSGSIIRGSIRLAKNKTTTPPRRRPGLYSFRNGNATLTNALADFLGTSIRYHTAVKAQIQREANSFLLELVTASGIEIIRAGKLVLATPSGVNSDLLPSIAPVAASALLEIPYAPVTVISHGYHQNQLASALRGFGFLIPRTENVRTLGCVWNSALFPGRAPADHVLITSFIGGATVSPANHLSGQERAKFVRQEIGEILHISGEPVIERVTDYPRAIPQYNLGHTERLRTIAEDIAKVPGLWLTGNYWNGPAIGTCVEHALQVAQALRIS